MILLSILSKCMRLELSKFEIQRYNDTNMGYRSVTEIQRYRYEIQRYRDTVIHIWDTEIQRYRDTVIQIWDTEIQWNRYEIQTVEIQMRYRPLGPSEYTEALGRVLGHFCFCPLGLDYACTDMMRYDKVFPCLSV